MEPIDERAQQVMEEERKFKCLEILGRMGEYLPNEDDVEFLAAELGLLNEYKNFWGK